MNPNTENQNPTSPPIPQVTVQPTVVAPSSGPQPTNQPVGSPPAPVVQPVAPAPIPSTPSTPGATPAPSPTPESTIKTQSDIMGSQKKTRRISKKLLLIGFVLLAIIGTLGVLVALGIIPLLEFKSVKYDNGKGASFNLTFYSQHEVKDPPGDSLSTSGVSNSETDDLKQLVAKKEKYGKAPLGLLITSTEMSDSVKSNVSLFESNCGGLQKAFTVFNKYANKDLPMCAVQQSGKDISYFTFIQDKDGKKVYSVVVLQDMEELQNLFKDTSTSNSELQGKAQEAVEKYGLEDYKDDIIKIVGSIKPTE